MGQNTLRISDPELLCYHEAGHAIVEYLLGYSLISIKVNPIEGYGECPYKYEPAVGFRIPESYNIPEIGKHILIYCAGSAAEYLLTNNVHDWHRSQDYIEAVNELMPVYKDNKLVTNYIEAIWDWAKGLLKQNWHVVETLANSLMWYGEEPDSENCWYGEEMVDELPDDFWERESGLRELDGAEASEIIKNALIEYVRTHKA